MYIAFLHCLIEDKCGPGEYSDTGLVPCIPCAKSTYSNESMSKRCIKCPLDMTTEFLGSTHFKHCSSKCESYFSLVETNTVNMVNGIQHRG